MVRERLQDPVADGQVAGLAPATRGADLMVGGAGELGAAVAGRTGDGELEEPVGAAVVEPADHLLGHDGADLGIVGQHLDRQALVDDLADLLLGAVGQRDPGAIGEAAEEDADLLAELVDEDGGGLGLGDRAGELAEGLAHETGLEADVGVAHLALDLGPGDQGGHGVDHDDVDGARADQHVGDLEGLLAGVRLGDQQLVGVDAEVAGVGHVQGVLGVDEGGDAAGLLGLGDDVQGEGGLARGLGTVDLDHAAPRHPADAEGQVEGEAAGRDGLDRVGRAVDAHAHDRALAELLLDLEQGDFECLLAFHGPSPHAVVAGSIGRGHHSPFPNWRPWSFESASTVLRTPVRYNDHIRNWGQLFPAAAFSLAVAFYPVSGNSRTTR